MKNAPKVFFVTRKWAPAIGGMETYSIRLTEHLEEFVDVRVCALPGQINGNPPSTGALLLFPLRVLKDWFVRSRKCQIMHLGDMALWPIGAVWKYFLRFPNIVLSAHGTDVAYPRRGTTAGRLYGAYLRTGAKLLKNASVIANSQATKAVLMETGWNRADVVKLATDMRGRANSHPKGRTILFSGRLVARKGCGWFITQVLPHLPPYFRLDVAGTGWDADEVTAMSCDRVNYLGPLNQRDLEQAYQDAFCVIVPNIAVENGEYEGFGLVAAEAAAAGGVVLAADRDGLTDAVIGGVTGFLIKSGNAQSWIDAIKMIDTWTDEDRARFLKQSTKAAQHEYNWSRVARETFEIYSRYF